MSKVRHVLGISGGKDSAAMAIYLRDKYPELEFDYYCCDTGKELDETYQLIDNLESYLGKKIKRLIAHEAEKSNENPFDYFYKVFKGYLPSPQARWCTNMMKLQPFERYVGTAPTVSYVGIRGDESREGYVSKKENIQSIFPFRRNIWSEDVWKKFFANENEEKALDIFSTVNGASDLDRFKNALSIEIPKDFNERVLAQKNLHKKIDSSLDLSIAGMNKVIFEFLKDTNYSLSLEDDFPLLENEDVLVRDDIFKILEESGVGVPGYYNKIEYEVDGKKGEYARSRSGCFFCFFQQKIEWVWLYEQHPDLFEQAKHYENLDEFFTWNQHESLDELTEPSRIEQIKREHLNRTGREKSKGSKFLLDILDDTEEESCISCFV